MNKIDLRIIEKPDAATVKMVDEILVAFNEEKMATERKSTAILAFDGEEYVGGVCFRRYGSSAVIDYLAIKESRRRSGVGNRLLAAAENKLRDEGCRHITLETMEHQAPEFYRRYGYKDLADIPEYYDNKTRYVLRKILREGGR